jgi:integrase
MAFTVYKSKKKDGWRLVQRGYINGKRIAKVIPREVYHTIGFRLDMSIEEARDRAKQLTNVELIQARSDSEIIRKLEHSKLVDSVFLPKTQVLAFERHLDSITMGMANRLKTTLHQWATVQKIIVELQIDPKDFYDNRHRVFRFLISKQFSLDYSSKLIRLLNLWGHFFARHTNTFFQPIPKPNMNEAQRFIDAREGKTGVRRESASLNEIDLKNSRSTFDNNGLTLQWNWLFVALWFGLRPSEVDNLKSNKFWRIDKIEETDVLMVYQTKLTGVPKDKRWKPIPIYFDEQKQAIDLILTGEFKRPTAKTVAKYLGEGHNNYSPRKGFTDLMLGRGFSLEDISAFLGHSSIDTTWKHYKNKMVFKLPKKTG